MVMHGMTRFALLCVARLTPCKHPEYRSPRRVPFLLLTQGVMCICYAQMMSAMLMFVLIALLVCAFIDEEQFLKTHYYTASKRLFMASMMYGAPAIVLIGAFYGAEFVFALKCLASIHKADPDGIRSCSYSCAHLRVY